MYSNEHFISLTIFRNKACFILFIIHLLETQGIPTYTSATLSMKIKRNSPSSLSHLTSQHLSTITYHLAIQNSSVYVCGYGCVELNLGGNVFGRVTFPRLLLSLFERTQFAISSETEMFLLYVKASRGSVFSFVHVL